MNYLMFIGITGFVLLAIFILLESLIIKTIKSKAIFYFLKSISIILISFLPLGIMYRDEYSIISFYFIIFILILLAGLLGIYNIRYDLKNGLVVNEFKIISVKRHHRANRHGGDYFTLKTEDGQTFDIDCSDYNLLKNSLSVNKDLTVKIEYYPKSLIINNIYLNK
ncbi:hypothetical protein [Anaerococcus sp. AGMB09787]|uniref:hypothetical protein n=1 Tax=Anaerococcus sp. AGMB09787 TaxID=2922869 RepID=UPI001FAFC66F|nr:hypothetical protein [Anaerococcus sp. AGMB09787]